MKINIGILTMNNRQDYFVETYKHLKNDDATFEIQRIVIGNSLTQAHILAWDRLFENNPDYAILFQDDISSGKNTLSAIKYILENLKPDFITFYSNNGYILTHEEGIFKINPRDFINEQGTAMSKETHDKFRRWITDFEFISKMKELRDIRNHDCLLQAFLMNNPINCYAVNPCLIQHVGEISTVGHNWKCGNIIRQSRNYLGDDKDALKQVIEWMK